MLTLDDLLVKTDLPKQHSRPHKTTSQRWTGKILFGFWEVMKIGVIVLASFLVGNIVTYAELYGNKIDELRNGVRLTKIWEVSDSGRITKSHKQEYLDTLFKTQKAGAKHNIKEDIYAYYKTRPQTLDFQFNTLPPDKRIIIPDLGIQAPINDVEGDIQAKMQDGSFTEELKQGVVHYPTTPWPDELGTTMIFGHTSNFFWVKSAYNTVFSKIPELKPGQIIQLIWNGKVYEYEVKEQEIVKPNEVPEAYAKKYDQNQKRLALMGCYPIGTRDKRVIVFAEPKWQKSNHQDLAYHSIPNF